jgi:hypothetical protein
MSYKNKRFKVKSNTLKVKKVKDYKNVLIKVNRR